MLDACSAARRQDLGEGEAAPWVRGGGLRFDKKGLQARAKLLRPLIHPDKHAGEGEEELALWTMALQALESALTTAMDEWGATPRRAAQKPKNGGGDNPLGVLAKLCA